MGARPLPTFDLPPAAAADGFFFAAERCRDEGTTGGRVGVKDPLRPLPLRRPPPRVLLLRVFFFMRTRPFLPTFFGPEVMMLVGLVTPRFLAA